MTTTKNKVHVKKGDTVIVISGKDKSKKGKVLGVLPKQGKVVVEGVNMQTVHQKPRGTNQQGGIIHKEGPIYSSKVMLVCGKCGKATRKKIKILEDKTRINVCQNCGETF